MSPGPERVSEDHAPSGELTGDDVSIDTAIVPALPDLAVPEGMWASIAVFDAAVDRWVERWRSPRLDPIAYGLSSAADHSLLWHVIGATRAARTGSTATLVRMAAVLGAESALTNGPVKTLFRRIRPERDLTVRLPYGLRTPITSSFPSGHATAAFTAASLLAQGRRGGSLWYGLAAAVAMTRVYVRLHHASDIVAGAALGLAFGHLARRIAPLPRSS